MSNKEGEAMGGEVYYIREMRTTIGNAALWWRAERCGYTCDLRQAGKYTEQEARSIERLRGTDKAYLCASVNPLAELHVDVHRLPPAPQEVAAGVEQP